VSGVSELRYVDSSKVNVTHGYHILEDREEGLFRASRWLTDCVSDALAQSGVDPRRERVIALVGTGLRELRAVERFALEPFVVPTEHLHFSAAVLEASPHIEKVITISNACSAGGHALALAQDLIELEEADAVIVAGTDAMTESMLAMIGRFAETPADHVRPFDAGRISVLLGEGAAALVVVPNGSFTRPLARLLSTGLSCDAHHETAPDADGIWRAMQDALGRTDKLAADVDLVVAHGTGTALNDPVEMELVRTLKAFDRPGPLITAIKGAIGHTSGGSALVSVDVAIRCLNTGLVPPIVGLREPLTEGRGIRLVIGEPIEASLRLACVNSFGFGGVNAITLLETTA
jgi:3-oxoacyl-[acyl-carrier-protein] synthase II